MKGEVSLHLVLVLVKPRNVKETTVECEEWDSNPSVMVVKSSVTVEIID